MRRALWKAIGGLSILLRTGMVVTAVYFAYFALTNLTRSRVQGSVPPCLGMLKNIGTALEMYADDHNGDLPKTLDDLTPRYLRAYPVCPVAQLRTYRLITGPLAPKNPDGRDDYAYVECTSAHQSAFTATYDNLGGLITSSAGRP